MTSISTPGGLQQSAMYNPTGSFGSGQMLMPTFTLPSTAPVSPGGSAGFPGGSPNGSTGAPTGPSGGMPPGGSAGFPVLYGPGAAPTGPGALSVVGGSPAGSDASRYLNPNPSGYSGMGPTPPAGFNSGAAPAMLGSQGPAGINPGYDMPSVQAARNSWQVAATDPRFWTSNQNVLQQTDPNSLAAAMSRFGGPTTPQAIGALQKLVPGSQDMGAGYERAVDQQNQNQWLYNYLRGRVGTTDSATDRAFKAQQGQPNGYTADEWADLQYRQQVGFGDGAGQPGAQQTSFGAKEGPPAPLAPVQEEFNWYS